MLARCVFSHKIHLGKIECAGIDRPCPYYLIKVSVDANILWNFLVSDINIDANLNFVNRDTKQERNYKGTWFERQEGDLLVKMQIGGEYILQIATLDYKTVRADSTQDSRDILRGDYDIVVSLWSGKKMLRQWQYTKAILKGAMQEIEHD